MRLSGIVAIVVAAAVNWAVWAVYDAPITGVPAITRLDGLTYSPFRPGQSPETGVMPTEAEIEEDIGLIAGLTSKIRTYGASGVLGKTIEIARRHGLEVMAGAWVDSNPAVTKAELDAIVPLARDNPNVSHVLVGNEVFLRWDVTVEQLIDMMADVRSKVGGKPVGASEMFDVWMDYPQLAAASDFIAVHIHPFWDGVPFEQALDTFFRKYDEIRRRFPDKEIIVTETGWPNRAQYNLEAVASLDRQAEFVRRFQARIAGTGIKSYIVEAFDQPWKANLEGRAGPYWGVWDAERHLKYPLSGPIERRPHWPWWAALALAAGIVPSLALLRFGRATRAWPTWLSAFLYQAAGTAVAAVAMIPVERYMSIFAGVAWAGLAATGALLFVVLVAQIVEAVDVYSIPPAANAAPSRRPARRPKVSIHVPARAEPPAMMRQTLLALSRLDWPDFEVLVLDNNTPDPALWQPVEALCRELGPRFRFFHLDPWPGFKAGALNFALRETAPDAEVIAVIDADYMVDPDWLERLVPCFEDPGVGLVQAPQDYRDGRDSLFKRCCFWEYAAFFRIGMVPRARDHAIILHGTMTMIRRSALEKAGGWAEWCICEDAELGLRLFADGWKCAYTTRSFGRGVMPQTLDSYRRQRFRWAFGATQILRRHARLLLDPGTPLTFAQRYHFIAGWLPWMADALGLVFAVVAFAWTAAAAIWPEIVENPDPAFTLPTLGVLGLKVARDLVLQVTRVGARPVQALGSVVAGLSLFHTVGTAMLTGLVTSRRPFLRTPKGETGSGWRRALTASRKEAMVLAVQIAIVTAWMFSDTVLDGEGALWMAMLGVMMLPYAAAIALSAFTNLRGRDARPQAPHHGAVEPAQIGAAALPAGDD